MSPLIPLLVSTLAATPAANGWQETLDRVAPSVVEMRIVVPRAFDDVSTGYSVAIWRYWLRLCGCSACSRLVAAGYQVSEGRGM